VNLLPRDAAELARADAALAEVFDAVIRLDGTLSGEHGIGPGQARVHAARTRPQRARANARDQA
jgi:FAD/FMN-containing dehydrogenase